MGFQFVLYAVRYVISQRVYSSLVAIFVSKLDSLFVCYSRVDCNYNNYDNERIELSSGIELWPCTQDQRHNQVPLDPHT